MKKLLPVDIKIDTENIVNKIIGPKDDRLAHDKIKHQNDFVELKTRYRSLEIYVKNQTSSIMKYSGYYFDSGFWYYHIKADYIKPGQTWFQACANIDGKALSGVTGGCAFEINGVRLGFGFTHPFMGEIKCSIVQGSAHQAYNATDNGKAKQVKIGKYTIKAYLDDAKHGAHRAVVFIVND